MTFPNLDDSFQQVFREKKEITSKYEKMIYSLNSPDNVDNNFFKGICLKRKSKEEDFIIIRTLPFYFLFHCLTHRISAADEAVVTLQLQELQSRDLIQPMENGGFVRRVLDDKTGTESSLGNITLGSCSRGTFQLFYQYDLRG